MYDAAFWGVLTPFESEIFKLAGGESSGVWGTLVARMEPELLRRQAVARGPRPSTPELRAKWRAFYGKLERIAQDWEASGNPGDPPANLLPTMPPELIGMTCGAKTRAGTPCKRRDLGRSGRCKLHGGRSTGPRGKTAAE